MPEFTFENSVWWLVPIFIASVLAAWVLYYRGRSFSPLQRRVLAVFRFLIFFLIGLLLLSPILKSSDLKEEKPILVWLEDHSRSMVLNGDSDRVREVLSDKNILNELEDKYTVEVLDFGKDVLPPSDSFSSTATNIYEALSSVRERYYNQNVGGVVVLSDGISNTGNNPAYAARGLAFPVFTLAFGDTTSSADMLIDRVVSNNVSYLNNNFPVEIYLKARELAGKDYTVTVSDNSGRKLFSQNESIAESDYFRRINLYIQSDKVGLQRFNVQVTPVGEEDNLQNNYRSFTVDVLNNRKKVAIIGSGPHPDMAAIANALKSVEKYEVSTYISTELPPSDSKADLYVLHDPNSNLLEAYVKDKTPVWIFQGPSTPVAILKELTGLTSGSGSFEEVEAVISTSFNLFSLSEDEITFARELPPLWSPLGQAKIEGRSFPLFTKKVGTVSTSDPLWFYSQTPDLRRAFTLGTGIWRWRMEDYRQQRNFERFDALVYKSVQYLTTARQDRRFVVDIASRFDESEPIRAEARLYNSSLELTNEPDLKITFTDEESRMFDFSFSRAQNTYRLNAGRLPGGVYTWEAEIELGYEQFTQRGSFVVEKSRLEESDMVARHQLLRNISRESGGAFFKYQELGSLREKLLENEEAKSIQTLETNTSSLITRRWIFAIFLILLALEWGLRKYFGNY